MSQRTKLVMWIGGVIVLFGFIFLVYAIDTHKFSIFADTAPQGPQTAGQLTTLPAPDANSFGNWAGEIAAPVINLFSK